MRAFKRVFLFAFVVLLLILEANALVAQGPYSTLTGTVLGIRAKMWLDVKNEKDETVVNFRVGRKTVYVPRRYPYAGEKVKVEYLTNRGVPVAYTVTLLGSQKEEGAKEKKE